MSFLEAKIEDSQCIKLKEGETRLLGEKLIARTRALNYRNGTE